MIRNIVFDLGNVLVRCDLDNALERIATGAQHSAPELARYLEMSRLVERFDAGELTSDQFHDAFVRDAGWKGGISGLRAIWEEMLSPDEEMIALMRELKRRGFHIYVLSNINPIHVEQAARAFHFIEETDGVLYSCEVGLIKPDPAIYELLLDRFNLTPSETLFIDDREANTLAAEAVGIRAIQHRSHETTRELLEQILKEARD